MAATISSTATRITISGNYKAFTSTTGSTSTVIQYSTGDAPASGDAGRFLMWKNNTSQTDTWEIRYIESATATTVTVGDGGFSSAPASGESFVISTNLADIETAEPVACTSQGNQYSFNDRDWELTSGAFLADVDKSLYMRRTTTGTAFPIANGCAVQFGRLLGGEANDSIETTKGCHITFSTNQGNLLIYTSGSSRQADGPVINYYGCLLESDNPSGYWFLRMSGPNRMIGCVADGTMGGRFYHEASEWASCRHSGNINNATSWSLGATFTRPISDLVFYDSVAAFKNFSGFSGTFRDVVFTDTVTDVVYSSANNSTFDFIDCTTFDDTQIFDNGRGIIQQYKSINYTLADSTGTGLTGAKLAVYDVDGTIQTGIQTSTSGAISEVLAKFYIWTDANPSLDKSPFDIRIRKYAYQFQDFQSAVSEPIKQEFRLPSNTVTVLSEAAAAALTFITIDFSLKTVTVQRSRTLSEIYDYCQSQLALDANMDEPEFLTSSDGNVFTFADDWDLILDASGAIESASGKTVAFGGTGVLQMLDNRNTIDNLTVIGDIELDVLITPLTGITAATVDFSVAGTYSVDGCTISEATNSSGGSITLDLINGSTVTTNTGPNITLAQPVDITAPNIIDNSRVQAYNVTKASELDNSVVSGGSGYSVSINLASANVDEGDTLRLRAAYQSGADARQELEAIGVVTSSGLTFLDSQVNDEEYIQYGVDGSTLSQFTWDGGNLEIDVTDADNQIVIQDIGAWYHYFITTSVGIADLFGCIDWEFYNQIKVDVDLCDIFIDNKKSEALLVEGGRVYRSDGIDITATGTTGPLHIVGGVGPPAGSGTTTLTLALDELRDTGLSITAKVYTVAGVQQGSDVTMTEADSGVYTGSYTLSGVPDGEYSVLFSTATRRKGHGKLFVRGEEEVTQEQFFDPNFDIVQSVNVTTTNLDMFGSDEILTEFGGVITVDPLNGTDNNTYPFGTPTRPVNSWSNAKAIADTYGIRKIQIIGALALNGSAEGYIFQGGNIGDSIDKAGYSVSGSTFIDLELSGASSGAHKCKGVTIATNTSGIDGEFENCGFAGTMFLVNGSDVVFNKCFSIIPGSGAPQITHGTNTQLSLRGYNGGLTLSSSTAGCNTTLEYNAGKLTLDASNTGGTISVRGIPEDAITDGSSGATIDLNSIVSGLTVADATQAAIVGANS